MEGSTSRHRCLEVQICSINGPVATHSWVFFLFPLEFCRKSPRNWHQLLQCLQNVPTCGSRGTCGSWWFSCPTGLWQGLWLLLIVVPREPQKNSKARSLQILVKVRAKDDLSLALIHEGCVTIENKARGSVDEIVISRINSPYCLGYFAVDPYSYLILF